MRRIRPLALLLVASVCLSAGAIAPSDSLDPADFDVKALLGNYPPDGSERQQHEIDVMLQLQKGRTSEEEARCRLEATADAFVFGSEVLGSWFDESDFPQTADLLRHLDGKLGRVVYAAKTTWTPYRHRPYVFAPGQIKPCLDKAMIDPFSYPSGHSAHGIAWATVLAELFPEHRAALMAAGRRFGTDRTLAGVHYPSDVAAGQKLGAEVARRLLADAGFHAQLEKAKEECRHRPSHPWRQWRIYFAAILLLVVIAVVRLRLRRKRDLHSRT